MEDVGPISYILTASVGLEEFFKDLDSIFAEVKGISDTAKQDKKFDEANEILNDIQVEILSIPSKSEKAEAKK
eukprot:1152345-Amorphochlora_amoeboformis.AAC.1